MSQPGVAPWMHESQHPTHIPGRYVRPASIEDALALLGSIGNEAKLVAGGTDLLVELDQRTSTPTTLIDLTAIEGLDVISTTGDRIEFGPLVTHNQAAVSLRVIGEALPLAQASLEVGSPALRNRATIVGNVVTASPANDTISALRALDTQVNIASSTATRSLDLAEFHTGVRRTVLGSDELVTGLSVRPLGSADRGLYLKLGLRRAQAISVVHLAIVLRVDEQGQINEARIALGSVAPTIITLPDVEQTLVSQQLGFGDLDSALIDSLADQCRSAVSPIDDGRATAVHRIDQVAVMVRRALTALGEGTHRTAHPATVPTLGGPTVGATQLKPVDVAPGEELAATVNGELVSAPACGTTLLDWLRERAGLTGTKEGCAEGECGACTVQLEGTAVLSCLVPDGRAHGATIVTIEGLAGSSVTAVPFPDELHPMQQSFIDRAAVQCGYCIPGFVMAAACLKPTEAADISARKLGLSGNLCRCTGYYAIERAVDDVGQAGGR